MSIQAWANGKSACRRSITGVDRQSPVVMYMYIIFVEASHGASLPTVLLLACPPSLISGDVLPSPDLSTFQIICPYSPVILSRPGHPHTSTSIRLLFPLKFVADLHRDIEELGHASVQADGLALVEVGLSVVCWYAFLGAGFVESMFIVSACLICSMIVVMLFWSFGGGIPVDHA